MFVAVLQICPETGEPSVGSREDQHNGAGPLDRCWKFALPRLHSWSFEVNGNFYESLVQFSMDSWFL